MFFPFSDVAHEGPLPPESCEYEHLHNFSQSLIFHLLLGCRIMSTSLALSVSPAATTCGEVRGRKKESSNYRDSVCVLCVRTSKKRVKVGRK